MKKELVIIAGPTATGKSALAVALAERIGGEIISADSMQVYRGMDIGTAKISKEEMRGIPHYLVDCLDPEEEFNVYRFQQLAKEALSEIYAHGSVPILCGGTGFYIQALLYDIAFAKEDGSESRERLMKEAGAPDGKGPERLYARLQTLDPEYAASLHFHNVKKVVRALEYIEKNGRKFSGHNAEERNRISPYAFHYFVLTDDRERLYQRIEERVDLMMEQGLLEEVRALKEKGYTKELVSMQGLGYKEILDTLDGACSLDTAVDRIKKETRHFAKRQLTWFRREKDVVWIDKRDFDYDTEKILTFMQEKLQNDKNGSL